MSYGNETAYEPIRNKDGTFAKGSRHNSKYTDEEIEKIVLDMFQYIKDNPGVKYIQNVYLEFDTYEEEVTRWKKNFKEKKELSICRTLKKIDNILMLRKLEATSERDEMGRPIHNPTTLIFAMKTSGAIEQEKRERLAIDRESLELEKQRLNLEKEIAERAISDDEIDNMSDKEAKKELDNLLSD